MFTCTNLGSTSLGLLVCLQLVISRIGHFEPSMDINIYLELQNLYRLYPR